MIADLLIANTYRLKTITMMVIIMTVDCSHWNSTSSDSRMESLFSSGIALYSGGGIFSPESVKVAKLYCAIVFPASLLEVILSSYQVAGMKSQNEMLPFVC